MTLISSNQFLTDVKKVILCSVMQLRYQSRTGMIPLFIIALLLIPVLAQILSSCGIIDILTRDHNSSIASMICCESVVIAVFSAILCNSASIYSHDNHVSSFLAPLPVKRSICLIGIFLAGLLVTTILMLGAYGIAVAFASPSGTIYSAAVVRSVAISFCYVFFCCSVALLTSSIVKRFSAVISIIISLIALPLIGVLGLSTSGTISGICSYLPCFASDMAINTAGTVKYALYPSVYSFSNVITDKLGTYGDDMVLMCMVSLVLGCLFIICSSLILERRDL